MNPPRSFCIAVSPLQTIIGALLAATHLGSAQAQVHFTHAPGTVGTPPSAVNAIPDPQDIFDTTIVLGIPGGPMGNALIVDNPASIGLLPGDNIDALHDDGTRRFGTVNGGYSLPFVFSVRPGAQGKLGTPIRAEAPFNAADLYQMDAAVGHFLLNDEFEMGLSSTNAPESIDGVALEPGGAFIPGRRILFSLAPGSPTLTVNGWSAADILTAVVGAPGTVQQCVSAANLGLMATDNLDGLVVYMAEDANLNGRLDDFGDLGIAHFSVSNASIGAPGTAVRAATGGNGVGGDIFYSPMTGSNAKVLDGQAYARLANNDDIDALDCYPVFFGQDPFFVGGAAPTPPRRTGPIPPGYVAGQRKPIGGVYIYICAGQLPQNIKWQLWVTLCSPTGQTEVLCFGDTIRLRGNDPRDWRAKAAWIAKILSGIQLVRPDGTPVKTDANGNPRHLFKKPVMIEAPPVPPAGGAVARVCAFVDQDLVDSGWALDNVDLCFSSWTASIVPIEELAAAGGDDGFDQYMDLELHLPESPEIGGDFRATFWNFDPFAPLFQEYHVPMAAGDNPLFLLSQMRDQINFSGGNAAVVGGALRVYRVPVEPQGIDGGRRGPHLLETGSIDNGMPFELRVKASKSRGCFVLGDLDENGAVDLVDLTQLLSHFGTIGGAAYSDGDLDGNGNVAINDLALLLSQFGQNCVG